MSADDHKTFSLRVTAETFERIKQNAVREHDGNVNQYVLSYLPECYDITPAQTETPQKQAANNRR